MVENKRNIGTRYEQMAVDYLVNEKHMTFLARNYHSTHGEIDIIAKDGECIVFCEVKYRKNTRFGYPEDAVNHTKQARLRHAAAKYLFENKCTEDVPVRFDVISILDGKIKHITNAF